MPGKKVEGRKVFTPYEVQPSNIVVVYRHYSSLKTDENYKRRVTWTNDELGKHAVVEYIGTFPGRIPHGNTKHNDDTYCWTPAETLAKIETLVAEGCLPKQAYNKLLLESDIQYEPRNSRQVTNMKYNKAAACRKAHANDIRMNVADEVLTVLNRVQTDSFVRSVTISKSKCPNHHIVRGRANTTD